MTTTTHASDLSDATASQGTVCTASLARYDRELREILAAAAATSTSAGFAPRWELPEPSPALERFFAPSTVSAHELGRRTGVSIGLLNLMHNPRTRTTKTFASLIIVARAVAHIRRTGEAIMIVTPSSANKATALRDAVLRAHETGLATEEELRIVSVVPSVSAAKLWDSPLTREGGVRRANPVAVLRADDPGHVKHLARTVVDEEAEALFAAAGIRLWHTLDLANYMVADAVRALFERDSLPHRPRIHAHSVSSAFGLLGHFHGQQWHTGREWPAEGAGYFLVQHLGTPDMVASLYHDRFDYRPRWRNSGGLVVQDEDPRFPFAAYAPDEQLDPTFYTRTPATSPRMNEIIRRQGGGGIVVSLAECLERYPAIRELLAPHEVELPADPRRLREWSLVMALTGVLNAIDRGLLTHSEVLVHASGSYHTGDFRPASFDHLTPVDSVDDLRALVRRAAA
ncbi:DUF6002 family protein [Streptomyces sp. NPDC005263]|uniref:DUF6002 family protein n=1 Tax=Streptomyces sp. NPDC005263 TaxID=3364711 RepID=UPI0036A6AC31